MTKNSGKNIILGQHLILDYFGARKKTEIYAEMLAEAAKLSLSTPLEHDSHEDKESTLVIRMLSESDSKVAVNITDDEIPQEYHRFCLFTCKTDADLNLARDFVLKHRLANTRAEQFRYLHVQRFSDGIVPVSQYGLAKKAPPNPFYHVLAQFSMPLKADFQSLEMNHAGAIEMYLRDSVGGPSSVTKRKRCHFSLAHQFTSRQDPTMNEGATAVAAGVYNGLQTFATLHTWPREGFMAADYSCQDRHRAVESLALIGQALGATHMNSTVLARSPKGLRLYKSEAREL